MLVAFSLKNYRSFASRQTISMVAGSGARKRKRFSYDSGNSNAPSLLRSACVFGPNGSGKSSLVQAFEFFSDFVISSAKDAQEGEKIDVSPFLLDAERRNEPSEFEATFIHGESLYQYGFSVDKNRVWGEWLFARPNSEEKRFRTMFQREFDPDEQDYVWYINRRHVLGEREIWRKSTRDNALFLSTAMQLKADALKEPFDWIQNFLRVIDSPNRVHPGFTVRQFVEENWKRRIMNLLQAIDIKIKDISIEHREADVKDFSVDHLSDSAIESLKKSLRGKKTFSIESFHRGTDGSLIPIDFDEESDGSQVVFGIAGPWFDVLENGYTLVIDELHNSLHPHALRVLVDLFHDPDVNKFGAQLIFTSHETSVMTKGFMHQDQVWLLEKDDIESSQLRSLSDYKVRDVSAFQKSYLDGRYGAVPNIGDFVDA